jgi:hypothetical protein
MADKLGNLKIKNSGLFKNYKIIKLKISYLNKVLA